MKPFKSSTDILNELETSITNLRDKLDLIDKMNMDMPAYQAKTKIPPINVNVDELIKKIEKLITQADQMLLPTETSTAPQKSSDLLDRMAILLKNNRVKSDFLDQVNRVQRIPSKRFDPIRETGKKELDHIQTLLQQADKMIYGDRKEEQVKLPKDEPPTHKI
ncbi:MAG: hypothetical protein ACHQJ6_07380 [Candidatus Berkiellales bacterium]